MKLPDSLMQLLKNKDGPQPEQYTVTRLGRQFEQFFFGFTVPDIDEFVYKPIDDYLPFLDALYEVEDSQFEGYNPSAPTSGCNEEFFQAVKALLPIGGDELQYFIAIGTKLDFFHGVDAFFSWRGAVVSLDASVDPEKILKADFLITPEMIENGEIYTCVAREIASLLITRVLDHIDPDRIQVALKN